MTDAVGRIVLSVLKFVGAPGSIGFLSLCLAIGLAVTGLSSRYRPIARAWLLLVVSGYVALSLPWTATAIAGRLPRVAAPDAGAARRIDALIVLDGDNWRGRVQLAGRIFAGGAPDVWVLGDAGLLDPLRVAGIPASRITHVSGDVTTRDQMARVQQIVTRGQAGTTAVIASCLQMPRVAALARTLDLHLMLLPSPLDDEPPPTGARRMLPSLAALGTSRDALYEHAALVYYRSRGWIDYSTVTDFARLRG